MLNLYTCDKCEHKTEVITVITRNGITGIRNACESCVEKSPFLASNALCTKWAYEDEILNPNEQN